MLKSDIFAWWVAILWVFFYESIGSPYAGFYVLPSVAAIESFFRFPFVSRELNAGLVFILGVLLTSAINMNFIVFVAPFYLILSSVLYVFAKK